MQGGTGNLLPTVTGCTCFAYYSTLAQSRHSTAGQEEEAGRKEVGKEQERQLAGLARNN